MATTARLSISQKLTRVREAPCVFLSQAVRFTQITAMITKRDFNTEFTGVTEATHERMS